MFFLHWETIRYYIFDHLFLDIGNSKDILVSLSELCTLLQFTQKNNFSLVTTVLIVGLVNGKLKPKYSQMEENLNIMVK